jgi:hypothetical protein
LRFEDAANGSQLIHCIIEYGNASGGFPNNVGGGTYMVGNAPVIKNCIYRYNVGSFGGAIFSIASSPVIEKCVFYGNACGNFGGAIQLQGGQPKVNNCTFYDNSADAGPAIYLENCDAEIQNSIFFMNDGFGAIYADAYSTDAQVKYCDFSNNPDGDFLGYKPPDFGLISTQNINGDPCDVYFNIFLNPEFTDYLNEDFTLTQNSPCINAGNPGFPHDPDGTVADIGALPYWLETSVTQTIILQEGWSGISGYVQPDEDNLEIVLGPVISNLEIMYNNDGMIWPDGGINTLDTWNSMTGYIIKVGSTDQLDISGAMIENQSVLLDAGWNILPVLSSCDVSIQQLFGDVAGLIMVKEIAGTNMYWPEMAIGTLDTMEPGKSYLVNVNMPVELSFPSCEP